MAEVKTAYSGQTPMAEDSDLVIENANRFLECVFKDIDESSRSSVRSQTPAPNWREAQIERKPEEHYKDINESSRSSVRPQTPEPNGREAQIERIYRFCDTIDLDTLPTPEEVRPVARRRLAHVRDRTSQPNTTFNDIIDLVNQPTQELLSTETISNVVGNNLNDVDDDVIIVSSELDPIVDLCMPVRQNTHRSRSPLHQRQCPVQTSTTHIQRPQHQRQLHLPNSSVSNLEANKDLAATSSNERVVLKCPVCMESSVKRKPTSTKCGHIFCESCINHAISITHKCPLCNMKLNKKMIFRIYL